MYVEQSNEEWRQWIKLTEKKESISSTSLRDSAIDLLVTQVVKLNEDIEHYKKRIEVLETENMRLCSRLFRRP